MKQLYFFLLFILAGILPAQNFHDTQGNIDVNGGGQLQYTLPIALPPGVKSVAPQINLVYTSGAGNGIAGYGWNLSGITSISRMSKTFEKDGELKGIQFDNTDYFSFNGQRLILKSGEYGKDGAEYVTEKYSNVRIKSFGSTQVLHAPVYFEVTFEDGSQAWYGETENDSDYNRFNSRTAIEYNIVKWKDAQGNSILYHYDYTTGQMQGGVSRISSITWGGNEMLNKPNYNEIKFSYIDRELKEESYVKGLRFLQDKLLSTIQVSTNGSQFKKYEISYKKDSNGTKYQYVNYITEYNSQNEASNPVIFNNQNSSQSTWASEYFNQENTNDVKTGDFDGDGRIDFIKYYDAFYDCLETETQQIFYDDDSNNYYEQQVCVREVQRPAGLYLIKGFLDKNNSSSEKVYLSNNISKDEFSSAIGVSIKDNAGIFQSNQGFATRKLENGNIIISLYKMTSGSIEYVRSKSIPFHPLDKTVDGGYGPGDIYSMQTRLGSLESRDIDGDGIPEILLNIVDHENIDYYDDYYNTYISHSYNEYLRQVIVDMENGIPSDQSYFVIERDNNLKNESTEGDFNGDGIQDEIIYDYANKPYLNILKKISPNYYTSSLQPFGNSAIQGNVESAITGDFNGDGKTDMLIPKAEKSFDWILYRSIGDSFVGQNLPGFSYYRPNNQVTTSGKTSYYSRQYIVQDINMDGKSDFIELTSKVRQLKVSGQNSAFIINFNENMGIDNLGNVSFQKRNIDGHTETVFPITIFGNNYDNYPFSYQAGNTLTVGNPSQGFVSSSYSGETHFGILAANLRINEVNRQIIVMNKTKRHLFSYYSVQESSRINSIIQGGLTTSITYKELDSNKNSALYKQMRTEAFPYAELDKLPQSYVISQLSQTIPVNSKEKVRKQDFRYRGFLIHFQGKGALGFRQTAKSSWYSDEYLETKIWSGSEMDPLQEGVPVKEWSIKTNDENQIFPSDLSVNNSQLLSFKSTQYRNDALAYGVKALVPVTTTSKDFQRDITTTSTITSYNEYYLPTQTVSSINNGFATTTTNLEYLHNPGGTGKDYYIGRPKSKTETVQVYGDSKGAKEDYEYENNLLKSKTSWNQNNSGWLRETYSYDGFGNTTSKTISNSADGNTQSESAQYEATGRFVVKKTDNLGLQTSISYNDWGQVLEQTDPLGNKLTNTYDASGKMLTSNTNLGGTTTYTYEKFYNGDARITEYSPDGDEKATYTNKIGQNYKTTAKAVNNGRYVSKEVQYDELGRKTAESEPYYEGEGASKWNTIQYDEYSRPIKVTSFTGKVVESSYNGRTVTVTETNANNRFKKQTADPLGNIIMSEDKGGVINFKFNAAGQVREAKYGNNTVTTQYDEWGRKSEFHDPSNGLYKYQYNAFGQLVKETSPKGYKEYTYNSLGQLISQREITTDGTQNTDKTITYAYNDKGLIISKNGSSKGKAFGSSINYDNYGRILSTTESGNGRSFWQSGITYDDKSRVTSYEKGLYSNGVTTKVTIENVYDSWSGELFQLKDKNTGKVLWELQEANAKGQVTRAKLGATDILNIYDQNGFLMNISHTTPNKTILQVNYSFNAIKNELNSRNTGGDFNILESFNYDDNNRLVSWTNPRTGGMSSNGYDAQGRIKENDMLGSVKFENNQFVYRPTSVVLNAAGQQKLANDLVQTVVYNENNDPVFIDGVKGDVRFEYGLAEMRQMATYGGNFAADGEGKFTKYYSEDGSFEITRNNQTGQEKHILYIGGSPYESNIIFVKNYTESSGSYKFLHKDYLGSILSISDEAGNKIEQRHYDAWGNLTHLQVNGGAIMTDENQIRDFLSNGGLLVDRGYTSHEHFAEVGLIHMNGRLYDPLLRRFLNADENIQDMFNTQNYNKYGYVLNNPLMYNDPSGEFIGIILGIVLSKAFLIGAAIGAASYLVSSAIMGQAITLKGFLKSTFWGAVSGAVTFGIGSIFSSATTQMLTGVGKFLTNSIGQFGLEIVRAGTHAVAQGVMSLMQGGSFQQAFWSGALGSLGAHAFGAAVGKEFANKVVGQIAVGAITGGIGAELSGGNFWQGAVIGGIVAGLNATMHEIDSPMDDQEDPPGGKRIRFRKARAHFLSNEGTTLDTDINSIDLSKVKQSDFKYDKKTGRYVATVRLLNGDQRSNLEDGLVHGSITMELLPGNKNYAQVAWNDKYNCRCGMYDFDVNFSKGNLSVRDHMTIWGSLVNSRFTPAGSFVTGTPFLIRYNNVFKLTK